MMRPRPIGCRAEHKLRNNPYADCIQQVFRMCAESVYPSSYDRQFREEVGFPVLPVRTEVSRHVELFARRGKAALRRRSRTK